MIDYLIVTSVFSSNLEYFSSNMELALVKNGIFSDLFSSKMEAVSSYMELLNKAFDIFGTYFRRIWK